MGVFKEGETVTGRLCLRRGTAREARGYVHWKVHYQGTVIIGDKVLHLSVMPQQERSRAVEDISLSHLKLEESGQLFLMNQSVKHICQTANPHKVSEVVIHIFNFN